MTNERGERGNQLLPQWRLRVCAFEQVCVCVFLREISCFFEQKKGGGYLHSIWNYRLEAQILLCNDALFLEGAVGSEGECIGFSGIGQVGVERAGWK